MDLSLYTSRHTNLLKVLEKKLSYPKSEKTLFNQSENYFRRFTYKCSYFHTILHNTHTCTHAHQHNQIYTSVL